MKPHQFSAAEIREEGPSLPDEFIRRVLGNPKTGPKAILQASYSAQALEQDRRADLRASLMRQRRELKEKLDSVEAALDELDALDCLERAT